MEFQKERREKTNTLKKNNSQEKDWPKRPSDHQLQEARKKTDRAIIPGVETVRVPHTWRRQGPHKPSSCTTFTLNPHWGRAATGKTMSHVYACRVASIMPNSETV